MATGTTPKNSTVICKEVFDDGYQPSNDEIFDYAIQIGINPKAEPHLLYLAKDGLLQAIPIEWEICYSDECNSFYYLNKKTKVRQWEHPLDAEYKTLVDRVRKQFAIVGGNDVSEDASQIDSGIRSLQGDDSADLLTDISPTPTIKMLDGAFPGGGAASRFLAPLEKRGNSLTQLQPLESTRNRRFEITNYANTSVPPQIGLSIRSDPKSGAIPKQFDATAKGEVKGFTLTGTGSMFLKSNTRKIDTLDGLQLPNGLNDKDGTKIREISGSGRNFKSILRDSSLTDVRNRTADAKQSDSDFEERKIVRFNLDAAAVEPVNGVSSEESSNEDGDIGWDFDVEGVETHVKDIRVTNKNVPPLKLSENLCETKKPLNRLTSLNRTLSNESVANGGSDKPSLVTLFDNGRIKPLYEDTDSESAISVRGTGILANTASKTLAPIIKKESDGVIKGEPDEINRLRDEMQRRIAKFKVELAKEQEMEEEKFRSQMQIELNKLKNNLIEKQKAELTTFESELKRKSYKTTDIDADFGDDRGRLFDNQQRQIEMEQEAKILNLKKKLEDEMKDRKIDLESQHNIEVENFKQQLKDEFEDKRRILSREHRSAEETLQKNHKEILEELDRDLKTEEELLRKDHAVYLTQVKENLAHELDVEKQRMRETGESRLYEKIRCEKRLLEDKYKCLKEKYARLKADVKLSLERRNQRKEQQSITTGSETERSNSNKNSIGNSEMRSSSVSAPLKTFDLGKPPALPPPQRKSRPQSRDESKKMGAAAKYLAHVQQYQDDTTSISQSDTTISNQYMHSGKFLSAQSHPDNGNSDSEAFCRNPETNNNNRDGAGRQRKKVFSRTKSASTSRLNSGNRDLQMRPCSPIENLRRQLQKLEDLEDQFPDNSLDTTYHLRYPFKVNAEISKDASSELEFFKHRIHLERDSVRRAKEALRTQRTNFRGRQREIKQRHKTVNRHTIDQMVQEEKELTEMEVNLHRTRSLLGEKVIRLRHLEQSLQRIYDKEKPTLNLHNADDKCNNKDDVTLSDLSSHSSSGFSSTDFASDTLHENLRRKEMYQESSEIIQSLENLNAEIREIWDILSKQQENGLTPPPPSIVGWPMTLTNPIGNLSNVLPPQIAHQQQTAAILQSSGQAIPTLADRLETYRQLTATINLAPAGTNVGSPSGIMAGLMSSAAAANTIVSQSPFGSYTTSLVERTQDLRNWLKQAKTENELLSGGAAAANVQTNL